MNEIAAPQPTRSLPMRVLCMILMGCAFQIAGSVLFLVAVFQVISAALGSANPRLAEFGRALGRYLSQVVQFESFATEILPFPFNDWPGEA